MKNWNWKIAIWFSWGWIVSYVTTTLWFPPTFWFSPIVASLLALPIIAWMLRK